jgi:hypothetical protein
MKVKLSKKCERRSTKHIASTVRRPQRRRFPNQSVEINELGPWKLSTGYVIVENVRQIRI